MTLQSLEPNAVWTHFERYCAIPHPSKHEQMAANHVIEVIRKAGFEPRTDSTGNIAVDLPASPGRAHQKKVILQCHLDMVPQKESTLAFDFLSDPIQPVIDGDWVRASGTTLGADNGIGVAIALSLLEARELPHGPLCLLFTVDEETGMSGALGLAKGFVTGDILINLDTEDEGELCVGCAGGIDIVADIPVLYEPAPSTEQFFRIRIMGLRGGHSGLDINLGRGNAVFLLCRLLSSLTRDHGCRLASITGGSARNAIPREAEVVLMVPGFVEKPLEQLVGSFESLVRNELAIADPDVHFEIVQVNPQRVLSVPSEAAIVNAVYGCPLGPVRMSDRIDGVVETSNNLATIATTEKVVRIACLVRSLLDSARDGLAGSVQSVFRLAGATVQKSNGYPGWQPNPSSGIVSHLKKTYETMYGKGMKVQTVHAGLECGIIGAVIPGIEMVSCGPTIRHPHSPSEKVHIYSVKRFWDFLVEALKGIESGSD